MRRDDGFPAHRRRGELSYLTRANPQVHDVVELRDIRGR
jgi:hypothetical protein